MAKQFRSILMTVHLRKLHVRIMSIAFRQRKTVSF